MEKTKTPIKPTLPSISDTIRDSLQRYFDALDGERPIDLYDMMLAEVQEPLLKAVLTHTFGVKTKASVILGISRGTLYKYLKQFGLEDTKKK